VYEVEGRTGGGGVLDPNWHEPLPIQPINQCCGSRGMFVLGLDPNFSIPDRVKKALDPRIGSATKNLSMFTKLSEI
jgi:hypothetical protein